MKLINKSRGTGKTTQLIYASAITGSRIITPNAAMAKYVEGLAKKMGLKIPQPISYVGYKIGNDRGPILIDEVQNQILDEALELYFKSRVVAATMTVPIDDDCVPPTPQPLVFDHETEKVRMKTNRDVFNETFGHLAFKLDKHAKHLEDRIMIQPEGGENIIFNDWLNSPYVERKENKNG